MRRSLSFKPLALSRTFIFLLIAYGLQLTAYPQEKRTDIEIYRNSIRTFSFVIKNKDVSTDKLYFTVKKERVDSLDRLIYRRNLLAGGADDQISASYSSPNSTVNVFVRRIDNWDLKPGIYQYDLISVDASDSNIVIPLYTGAFKIKENVLNAWDGTNLPDSGRTWFVLGEGKYQNDFAVYDSISGRWLPITVDSVIKLLSIEAGSTPDSVIYPYETTNFVTKTNTQTITGEKTFDASKTVFSGDSVGVRGDLVVDRGVYFYGSDGDLDKNGAINSVDITKLQNYLNQTVTLTKIEKIRADINGDGRIDWDDKEIHSGLNGRLTSSSDFFTIKDSLVTSIEAKARKESYLDYRVKGILTVDSTAIIGDYTLPLVDGTSGQAIVTDGAGNLSFSTISGSGGSAFELDGNGDLMPITGSVSDTYWELDGSGDLQPKL